jgi:hypothetical protein
MTRSLTVMAKKMGLPVLQPPHIVDERDENEDEEFIVSPLHHHSPSSRSGNSPPPSPLLGVAPTSIAT